MGACGETPAVLSGALVHMCVLAKDGAVVRVCVHAGAGVCREGICTEGVGVGMHGGQVRV